MKKAICFLFSISHFFISSAQYDLDYVSVNSLVYNKEKISYVAMARGGNRVKVKYFASRDFNRASVYQRFMDWSKTKNIIAVSSGTYMSPSCDGSDPTTRPVGLCVDNGVPVNKDLIFTGLDGLAVVYPSGGGGGMAVSNLKDGNLNISGPSGKESINIRNTMQLQRFISWAESNSATVFQAHLFVFKNKFLLDPSKVSSSIALRRVLAVGEDPDGQIVHYIVDFPNASQTIYDAALKAYDFLTKRQNLNISFMINLDTGCQNVFNVYKQDGSINTQFRGDTPLNKAANLLVYYFE